MQDQDSCVVEIRRLASIGKLEDSISVTIPRATYVAKVPWGGWVVTEHRLDVIEYDSKGDFRKTFGRRGEGPGELRDPATVAVDPTDSTWIADRRGRAVVFGPDGLPARTLISPHLTGFGGFTSSGLLYALHGRTGPFGIRRLIQIWSREGEPLSQLGPGRQAPGTSGATILPSLQAQSVVVGDTLAVFPGVPGEDWLTYWSASQEWTSLPTDTVWRALGLLDVPSSSSDGGSVAISSDGSGGFWVLGKVRRLSEREEAALVARTPNPRSRPNTTAEIFRRDTAPVKNAVYDGAIIHVASDGAIISGAIIDEYAWGFSSPNQFYTFTEEEWGLIKIHIWELKEACPVTRQPPF
jgi:hypothetical protein